jgi:hypothetical protein
MVVSATAARAIVVPSVAAAHDDCDEMTLASERDRVDDDDGDGGGDAAGPSFVHSDVVVPCALIDSGALGPDCHDAAVYVVTTHGTTLCRIDIATLASSRSTDTIDDGPPASSTTHGGHVLSPGTSVETSSPRIPRPGVFDVPAARGPLGPDRGRDVVGFVPPPS